MEKVLFFKQKAAYEGMSSAWSSDVCSSDLHYRPAGRQRAVPRPQAVLLLIIAQNVKLPLRIVEGVTELHIKLLS